MTREDDLTVALHDLIDRGERISQFSNGHSTHGPAAWCLLRYDIMAQFTSLCQITNLAAPPPGHHDVKTFRPHPLLLDLARQSLVPRPPHEGVCSLFGQLHTRLVEGVDVIELAGDGGGHLEHVQERPH